MKKNILIIVLSVVALLLAGTVGYLIADKVISNKYENGSLDDNKDNANREKEEVKELGLNDSLVTSLIYPKDVMSLIGYKKHWNYKTMTVETLGRRNMMHNAAFGLEPVSKTVEIESYSAKEVKENFVKIFGPDVDYYDGDISDIKEACYISKYDSSNNTYIAYTGCGGASIGYVDRVSKAYKAEQNSEYIYVYEYVQSVSVGPSTTGETVVYLLDKNDEKTTVLNLADESNYESLIHQMMDKGEVDTYKWTFKKQSDGKYYFYSGAWEN